MVTCVQMSRLERRFHQRGFEASLYNYTPTNTRRVLVNGVISCLRRRPGALCACVGMRWNLECVSCMYFVFMRLFVCENSHYTLTINMALPYWIRSTTKCIIFGVGLVCVSEYAWSTYKRYSISQRKKTQANHASDPIAEVLFFSEESASCRNHANSNMPCNLSSCPTINLNKITKYLGTATRSVDVCVYFLTCNAIVKAIIDLQEKNVFVRVITDDGSSDNEASQVLNMRKAGIRVRSKRSIYLMHHKFVIIDKKLLISGSANWTMQAFYGNYENILVTNHSDIVTQYVSEFEKRWLKFNSEVNANPPQNIRV